MEDRMTNEDGGPAFPRAAGHNGIKNFEEHHESSEQDGMTLRDYFAAKAMAAPWSDALSALLGSNESGIADEECLAFFSANCYALADAMLKARDEQ
jgi:hypothetical protein